MNYVHKVIFPKLGAVDYFRRWMEESSEKINILVTRLSLD